MKKRISQFVPGLSVGDAVSNYTFDLDQMFREMGYETALYADKAHVSEKLKDRCQPYQNYKPLDEEETIFYHYSVGSPISDFLVDQKAIKIIVYHNITPAHYFKKLYPERAKILKEGRDGLNHLVGKFDYALGVSKYNRDELQEMGFDQTGVLPLYLDEHRFDAPADQEVFERNQGVFSLISVGRIAPNKGLEETIRIFYFLKKEKFPLARLFLIGSFGGMETYHQYLMDFASRLDLLPEVVFPGHVTNAKLRAYYEIASIYLCTSEHEGFCLPLLEAMRFSLPVFAYDNAVIPETMGGCGVLIHEKRPEVVADLITAVVQDQKFLSKICQKQEKRWKQFRKEHLMNELNKFLSTIH